MSWQVRIQADDFFNAYLILKESDKALVSKLEKSPGKTISRAKVFGAFPTGGVGIVCLSFALELYIKDVYYLLKMGKKWPRGRGGHNILRLYEGLPEEIRKKIFAHDLISQNPFYTRGNIWSVERFNKDFTPYDGFIDQIEAISNSFEEWRYAYEYRALRYETGFAEALIMAVKSAADGIRGQLAA